jgi:hypothetical protein
MGRSNLTACSFLVFYYTIPTSSTLGAIMQTLAFTNTTHTKESAVALATWHFEQDNYLRQTYGKSTPEGWKACSVGCMSKGENHKDYPMLFGIDTRIAYLSDRFFENLEDYKTWTVRLFSSIKEGSDTTNAYHRFMHWMLMDSEHGVVRINDTKEIRTVGKLFERAAAGDVPTVTEWREAAYAANNAAYAAAYAANNAAYAAADAANAAANAAYATNKEHYKIMADKLCYFLSGGV